MLILVAGRRDVCNLLDPVFIELLKFDGTGLGAACHRRWPK